MPLLPGTGRPCRKWRHLRATPAESVAAWWPSASHNPGIVAGPSRLVLVDLDDLGEHGSKLGAEWSRLGVRHGRDVLAMLAERAGQPVPPTYTVRSWRGGEHRYYRAPEGRTVRNSAGRVGPLVDIRGTGGLIVGAGSIRDGRRYEVLDDRPPVPLPGWIAELAAPRPVPIRSTPVRIMRCGGYGAAALAGEVDALLAAPRGTRNDSLNRAAFKLGTLVAIGELDETEVMATLLSVAETLGLSGEDGTAQCERTIASGLTAGIDHPRDRVSA